MNPIFYSEGAGAKGLPPLSPALPIPAEPASASLRTISLDDSEYLLHNHHVSVASLRLLFTFAPERRSASLRNRCSPSPEYPHCRTVIGVHAWNMAACPAYASEAPSDSTNGASLPQFGAIKRWGWMLGATETPLAINCKIFIDKRSAVRKAQTNIISGQWPPVWQ